MKPFRKLQQDLTLAALVIFGVWGMIVIMFSRNLGKYEEETGAIFHNTQVGLMLLRDGRQLVRANQRLADIFGYETSDAVKRVTMADLYPSKKAFRAFMDQYHQKIVHGGRVQAEARLMRKDGTLIWCAIAGKALDARPEPDLNKGIIWVVDDITPRKAMELEIVQQREEAEQARHEAEGANRFKSDFLANMSHEIRTPMNAIIGMTYLLKQQALNDDQKNYVDKIEGSSNSLLNLINDILDFSKIEAGKLDIEQVEFDLHTVIENVSTLIEIKAIGKCLDFIVYYSPGMNMIRFGDPLRIGQILTNLANNAVKFTEQGEVGIYIEQTDSGLIRFQVKDTGIGLTPEQQSRLFQSFSQADTSTTRKYGGTGLGLAISKQLVTLMGGRIWVESEANKGSSFIFELPLEEKQGARGHEKIFNDKRVLVVDDTRSWQQVLVNLLRYYGIEPDVAASGEEAVSLSCRDNRQYDLVFMDWHLPGMDGIEAANQIRQHSPAPPTTIIMVSAYRKETVFKAASASGIDVFLEKPISPSLFYNALVETFEEGVKKDYHRQVDTSLLRDQLTTLKDSSILLVEDNALNREIIHGMLKESGILITDAENGQLAVDTYLGDPDRFELILMDLQMPVMDGYGATRLIRQQDTDVPIIALTANAMVTDIRRTRDAGMNEHLNKPIDVEKLFATLLKYIRQKCDPQSLSGSPDQNEPSGKNPDMEIPDFISIDKTRGLKHIMGNTDLYSTLLRDFAREYKNAAQTLNDLLAQDRAAAERLAHTIKGLSANIGAMDLNAVAEKMEQELSQDFMPGFAREIDRVVTEIEACEVLYQTVDNPSAPPLDPDTHDRLIRELTTAIERKRPALVNPVLEQLESHELPDEERQILAHVRNRVKKYKFKEALEALRPLSNGS